jgi:hypothetical protein
MKIRPSLGHEPGGGSGIDNIEDLHHMLLFAKRIRRHAGRVLEIELNLFHGVGTILWSTMAMSYIQDTAELAQDTKDSCVWSAHEKDVARGPSWSRCR